jgi:hypothetical protein
MVLLYRDRCCFKLVDRKFMFQPSEILTYNNQIMLFFLYFRDRCTFQLIDKKFLSHLSEMHPTSALHELCTKLDWPSPNLTSAFECGPPMGRMYIWKVSLQ